MNYRALFEVYQKKIDYIIHKSALFNKNFIHNIKQSGDNVEVEIRNIFRQFLPNRYRVTSGYIVSAVNKNDPVLVSPQIDMIIVDTLVPHSIFSLDEASDVEVVPLESVLGIFEIKRTLTKKVLKESIEQIKSTIKELRLDKNCKDMYLPGGVLIKPGLAGGYPSNPMLGIISILETKQAYTAIFEEPLSSEIKGIELDIITSLGRFICAPGNFTIGLPKEELEKIRSPAGALPLDSNFYCHTLPGVDRKYIGKYAVNETGFTVLFADALGYLSCYLQAVVGRPIDANNYFMHKEIATLTNNSSQRIKV